MVCEVEVTCRKWKTPYFPPGAQSIKMPVLLLKGMPKVRNCKLQARNKTGVGSEDEGLVRSIGMIVLIILIDLVDTDKVKGSKRCNKSCDQVSLLK